jgi:hypothetical protein
VRGFLGSPIGPSYRIQALANFVLLRIGESEQLITEPELEEYFEQKRCRHAAVAFLQSHDGRS